MCTWESLTTSVNLSLDESKSLQIYVRHVRFRMYNTKSVCVSVRVFETVHGPVFLNY